VKTKKAFPILFSLLAIAFITSTAILGNSHVAYAGGPCNVNPDQVLVILAQGESQTIQKQVTSCGFTFEFVSIFNDDDCTSQGIDVILQQTAPVINNLWEGL